jgi:hypothetical protein
MTSVRECSTYCATVWGDLSPFCDIRLDIRHSVYARVITWYSSGINRALFNYQFSYIKKRKLYLRTRRYIQKSWYKAIDFEKPFQSSSGLNSKIRFFPRAYVVL